MVTGVAQMTGAGESAMEQAELFDEIADSFERQILSLQQALAAHRQRSGAFRAGARGEREVATRVEQILVDLGRSDWHLLADRRWPGTRHANLDLILVGPPGILVIDSKKWREPRIEDGQLWNGEACEDDELDSLRDQADAVALALAPTGLAPCAIAPLLVLAGRRLPPVHLDGVTVVGDRDIDRALVRMPARLEPQEVEAVVAALDQACPPAGRQRQPVPDRVVRPTAVPTPRHGVEPKPEPELPSESLPGLARDELWADLLASAAREPIESWMTWLHPMQNSLVSRTFNGPARIRGAAGTGKTVVALHRARHLARQPGSRVLVTSFVRTLADVHRTLLTRLDPDLGDAVTCTGVHQLAFRIVRERTGQVPRIATRGGRAAFDVVWDASPHSGTLLAIVDSPDYWWDEVRAVIKGRGLTREEDYLALSRVGRNTPLQESSRRLVWSLFEAYQAQLAADGAIDYDDLIAEALAHVRAQPLTAGYTHVIVDEVQDLTCHGLRLLHAIVGDRENGLLLVGDGQQSVYVGGFTLVEAGVSVPGARSTILTTNYRNATEILAKAWEVVSGDQFDDLDPVREQGRRTVEVARCGGQVLEIEAADAPSQSTSLLDALTWAHTTGNRLSDMAVLTRTNREARTWCDRLTRHGVETQLLLDYDGQTGAGVKVGTYQRAKGLEFAVVFLPDVDAAVPTQRPGESTDAYAERASLQRRQLFVAMTRARDRLWLGRVTAP
jgi:hypothetical protein